MKWANSSTIYANTDSAHLKCYRNNDDIGGWCWEVVFFNGNPIRRGWDLLRRDAKAAAEKAAKELGE